MHSKKAPSDSTRIGPLQDHPNICRQKNQVMIGRVIGPVWYTP